MIKLKDKLIEILDVFLDLGTGGIFQLRQGQQRRIKVVVKPVRKSGMLPIICQSIVSVSVGCPVVRSELQKALDSYQEDDLNRLRRRWSNALAKRREVTSSIKLRALEKELALTTTANLMT